MTVTPERAQAVNTESADTTLPRVDEHSAEPTAAPAAPVEGKRSDVVINWEYVSLSEPSVVKTLIRTRSFVDDYYNAVQFRTTMSPIVSDGMLIFDENILTTYIDLDTLIDECGLNDDELKVVNCLMDGMTINELARDMGMDSRSTVFLWLDTAADKIVARNDARWEETMERVHRNRCKRFIKKRKESTLRIKIEKSP